MDKLRVTDTDLEIETDTFKVSLLCPLMKSRLRMPGRSSECRHVQCFELESFLLMNEKKPTWTCPVCDRLLSFDTLVIDSLTQEIVAKCPSNVEEVQFNAEGEWSRVGAGSKVEAKPKINNVPASTSKEKKNMSVSESFISDTDDDEESSNINAKNSISSGSNDSRALRINEDLVNICGKVLKYFC